MSILAKYNAAMEAKDEAAASSFASIAALYFANIDIIYPSLTLVKS